MRKKIQEKAKDGTLVKSSNGDAIKSGPEQRKRGRWDQTIDDQFVPAKKSAGAVTPTWTDVEKTPQTERRWDETPGHKGSETPGATPRTQRMWDATPAHSATASLETPAHEKSTRRNRWDETPKTERGMFFCNYMLCVIIT